MFGALGYGYEWVTGSDLGEDLVSGGQYLYDTTTGAIYDAGSAALESANQIYESATEIPGRVASTVYERATEIPGRVASTVYEASGARAAADTAAGIQQAAEKTGRLVRNIAIGAGVVGAGLLALALGRRG